ncbi:hypothetical protein D3C86_1781030 [compost metagenome]
MEVFGRDKKKLPLVKAAFYHMILLMAYANTLVTRSAASFNAIAEYTFSPDSSINCLASAAFVPCKRQIIGTGIFPISL